MILLELIFGLLVIAALFSIDHQLLKLVRIQQKILEEIKRQQ